MKSRKFMAVAMAAISIGTMAAFASCGGNDNSGSSEKKSLNITGSSSVSPLMGKLADAYKRNTATLKLRLRPATRVRASKTRRADSTISVWLPAT